MSTLRRSSLSVVFATLVFVGGLSAPVAQADDTEVFFTPVGAGTEPNILFILDSSASMGTEISVSGEEEESRPDWDPNENWLQHSDITATGCQANRLYWQLSGSIPKDCAGLNYIEVNLSDPEDASNKFVCKPALDTLRSPDSQGYVLQANVAQFNPQTTGPNASRQIWIPLATSRTPGRVTECKDDDGVHGLTAASPDVHPRNKTANGFGTSNTGGDYTNALGAFTTTAMFYTAGRIAWESIPAVSSGGTTTRMEVLKAAMRNMLLTVNGVRVGLMRFDNNGSASRGGMIVHDMTSIDSGREDLLYTLYEQIECKDPPGDPPYCRKIFVPGGTKSIGESLFEALNYFGGCVDVDGDGTAESCPEKTLPGGLTATGSVVWGDQSNIDPFIPFESVPESIANYAEETAGNWMYKSPVSECGKNFIVLLTDGLTEQDNSNDTAISKLPDFDTLPGIDAKFKTCDVEELKSGSTASDCVDDVPGYMWERDVNSVLDGIQNVKTFTVGFDLGESDLGNAARQVLRDAATRGGGEFYEASDETTLTLKLGEIARQILIDNASFTAPSVAVNAFNRTQNLNDLFMAVFKPSLSYRWLGNLKKYRLTEGGQIVDANGKPAVDPATGFFATNTQSYWSDVQDGSDATLGGAAGELKSPGARKIYTNVDSSGGTLAITESGALSTQLSVLKATDTATVALANNVFFGITAPAVVPTSYPSVTDLVDWAYGYDIQDLIGTVGTTDDARLDMGDPLHARPATVIYGGPANDPDTTIFLTTNDGLLHAVNAKNGTELWAFAPVQLLPRLHDLYTDDGITDRVYGLDGPVKSYKVDVDFDGVVEPADGDKVLIFFGMRRGGSHLFALDVTNRTTPELLWRIGDVDDPSLGLGSITATSPRHLPGIGQTWSSPTITRMNINRTWGATNTRKLVAVIGGGYDPSHDVKSSYADDTVGNRIYIVDAISGDLIWRAGPTSGTKYDAGADLKLAKMTSAIPGEVRSFDLTGDGFDDRMYAADLGGRIWRFDIADGAAPASLVTGGVLASLGVADETTKPDTANRKFFYAPDASLIRYGGRTWINIAIGSGDRERPVSEGRDPSLPVVQNRFYSLRDYNLFVPIANNRYLDDCSLVTTEACHEIITTTDSRLTDVTCTGCAAGSDALLNPTLPADSVGWYLNLSAHGEAPGEKVLAESRTFNNTVYFSTYVPRERNQSVECGLAVGVSKLFVVSAINAEPMFNYDIGTDGVTSISDRSKDLSQGAIAPEVVFVFPTPDQKLPGVTPPAVPPVCLVGLESCGGGITNPPVRTYWRQRGAN